MGARKLIDEYLKLDTKEQAEFDICMNKIKRDKDESNKEKKREVYNKMMEIRNDKGEPYFNETYLKDTLKLND